MPDSHARSHGPDSLFSDHILFDTLTRVGLVLGVPVEQSDILILEDGEAESEGLGPISSLMASAEHAGLAISESHVASATALAGFVREGYPIILAYSDGRIVVLERASGRRVEATVIGARLTSQTLTRRELRKLLKTDPAPRRLVCQRELACGAISATAGHQGHQGHGHADHHASVTPQQRFFGLLNLDLRDIWMVILFAFVAGILALATPLAVESLVNVVSWGTYLQPVIILGLMLLTCLGLAGLLRILQTILVELIQRRQFVRIVSDLAHRFPRVAHGALSGTYPREFANRVFDIMTIQKATAVLLLDGVTIVLTTVIGLVLLAFYHPFLLGFDIVLLISMISITWILGTGGIRTSIDESIAKYKVAHWLQDVIAFPAVFKTGGGEALAVQRANQLAAGYITARESQFRVVIRQVSFAIALQVIASTVILALGGWLVIDGQLTLGQLVASELVVTVVVGAFAKAGKALEKWYDLMAGIDKVGHLIDIPTDPRHALREIPAGPADVRWTDLSYSAATSVSSVPAVSIEAGSRAAIVGDDVNGRSLLAQTLAGLITPQHGIAQIAGFDAANASANDRGQFVGYVGGNAVFHGTLRENVDLARSGIRQNRVRQVLQQVGLAEAVLKLPDGLQTRLQTEGYPLNPLQARQLCLARAMVTAPKLLIIDGLLDDLAADDRRALWQTLAAPDAPWTLVVNTNREDIAALCELKVAVRKMG